MGGAESTHYRSNNRWPYANKLCGWHELVLYMLSNWGTPWEVLSLPIIGQTIDGHMPINYVVGMNWCFICFQTGEPHGRC